MSDAGKFQLAEKNIIVAAGSRAAVVSAQLLKQGARVWPCPALSVEAADDYELLEQALENLYGYDWLLFTTVYGIDFFLRRFAETGGELSGLDDLRVCAVGAATVARLADEHLHVDLAPARDEMVWQNLVDYVGAEEQLRYLNVLAPRGSTGHSAMIRRLEAGGARVDVVPAYRIAAGNPHEYAKITALLNGGGIDGIVFAEAAGVADFAGLFDTSDLSEILSDMVVMASVEAARAVRQYGLQPELIQDDFSVLSAI